MTMIKIDSHQHFWNYDPIKYQWIDESTFICRMLFTVVIFLFWISIRINHRLKLKNGPKGVWLRYNEINKLNIDWIKRNIEKFTETSE